MARLRCRCDYIIEDNDRENAEWKGYVGSYLAWDVTMDRHIPTLASYIESIEQGTRAAWMAHYYPANLAAILTHTNVISDVFGESQNDARYIYECEQCGRLHLYHPREKGAFSFTPDEPDGPRGFLQPQPPREGRQIIFVPDAPPNDAESANDTES
jgi:hypothetical protein